MSDPEGCEQDYRDALACGFTYEYRAVKTNGEPWPWCQSEAQLWSKQCAKWGDLFVERRLVGPPEKVEDQ